MMTDVFSNNEACLNNGNVYEVVDGNNNGNVPIWMTLSV